MINGIDLVNILCDLRDEKKISNLELYWNIYLFEYRGRKYNYNTDTQFLQWKENGESLAIEKVDVLKVIENIKNLDSYIFRNTLINMNKDGEENE